MTLNEIMEKYHMRFRCGSESILDFAKIFSLEVWEEERVISLIEADQFSLKCLMLDLIAVLETKKPRLLLLEYPEYGLTAKQGRDLLARACGSKIEYILLHTQAESIRDFCPHIYAYHFVNEQGICTFDDYEELAEDIAMSTGRPTDEKLEQGIIGELFREGSFAKPIREYIKNNAKIAI